MANPRTFAFLVPLWMSACIHPADYPKDEVSLTSAGEDISFLDAESTRSCDTKGLVIGRGQSSDIKDAITLAMRHARHKASERAGVNGLEFIDTEVTRQWRTYFVALSFTAYSCDSWSMLAPAAASGAPS